MFFGGKRKKEQKIDDAFARVYEEIQSIENWDDPKKLEHYILDSCEQIIAMTKEIEGEKAEYRIVTAYLNDIESIEKMPEQQAKELKDVASNIVEMNAARTKYLNTSFQITDEQFFLMEQEEEDMPGIIQRMMEHEKYQDGVKKDQVYLDGQKSRWVIERDDLIRKRNILKNTSIVVLIFYVFVLLMLTAMDMLTTYDLTIPFLILFALGATGAFAIYIYMSTIKKKMRVARRKANESIDLLNVSHMKYANITKSIEYTKEKFNVRSAAELNYVWDQYLEAVREKERFIKNNEDLEYFNGRLIRILQKINLYDRKIWLDQTKALIDEEEMVEIRHNLVKRRQKIREHIEEQKNVVQSERNEITRLMDEHEHYVPEIIKIIESVDKLCGIKAEEL